MTNELYCVRGIMSDAITALSALCRTSRRLDAIVRPILYEEPLQLLGNTRYRPDRGLFEGLFGLVSVLGQKNGLADLVRVYKE